MEPLDKIGFYTMYDERVKHSSETSPLKRCELLLTGACNFKCPYCRGLCDNSSMSLVKAKEIVYKWATHNLENIRFSGGEPTIWPHLVELVAYAKNVGIQRIAISSNGSAKQELYEKLVEAGANDFSISLDACCSSTCDAMAGREGMLEVITNNIKYLSSKTYVTVGVVLTEKNQDELKDIVKFAKSLGVSDIRIISAAQKGKNIPVKDIEPDAKYPILSFRVNRDKEGLGVRGILPEDSHNCPLVLDDMAVVGEYHYPCIIYLREGGKPLGSINDPIEKIRADRAKWAFEHDTHKDPICCNNCLDVCTVFNNRWNELNGNNNK